MHGFWGRLAILVVTLPVAIGMAAALSAPGVRATSALYACAFAFNALRLNWYAVGASRPQALLWCEVAPKAITALVCLPLILVTHAEWIYGVLLIVVTGGGLAVFHQRMQGRFAPEFVGGKQIRKDLRHNLHAWLVEAIGSGYSPMPVPVAAAFTPVSLLAWYNSADRIYRYDMYRINSLANGLQGWVLERESRARHRLAIAGHFVLGLVGAALLIGVGPWATGFLFGAAVASSRTVFIFLASAFACNSVAAPLIRNIVVPRGRSRSLFWSSAIAGVLGLAAMVSLARVTRDPAGVAFGLALSEFVMLAIVIVISARSSLQGLSASVALEGVGT